MEHWNCRKYWVGLAGRLARPLLTSLASGRFWKEFPAAGISANDRSQFAGIESLSRLLAGIAPWLESEIESPTEAALRDELLILAQTALKQISDPACAGFREWSAGPQAVVEAAFLSHAFVRAPNALWKGLEPDVQANLLECLRATKVFTPYFNNWLLFAAILEVFLHSIGEQADLMRIDYAVRQHEQWYAGDGCYKDGPGFHADYYNSFVIHPMLFDILKFRPEGLSLEHLAGQAPKRLSRYAAILERQISPEGTFPPVGRSLAYRFGAFQALSQTVCEGLLPAEIKPAQVRCALTKVIQRMVESPETFDDKGFLQVGFAGHQPSIGEPYITAASTYLCATVLLPLGLPASHAFWSDPDADWTALKLWNGEDLPCDKALRD
jgi:hypothetical protein